MQPPMDTDSELFEFDAFEFDEREAGDTAFADEIRRRRRGRRRRRRSVLGRPSALRQPRRRLRSLTKPRPQPWLWNKKRPKPWRGRPRRRVVIRRRCAPCICPAHGTEFVRWVQSSLNRLAGLDLRINGIMNRATRDAVRNFQRRNGLPVDGIAGPDTEQTLLQAKSGQVRSRRQSELAFDDALLAPRSKGRSPHKKRCSCAACRQDRMRSDGLVSDLELELEDEFRPAHAIARNRHFGDTLGWDEHYFRIAQDLLGISMFPIEERTFAEAVAAWQQRNCFSAAGVDGIIGPRTWREMSHLLGLTPKPSPTGPVPEVNVLMPRSGPGFCTSKPQWKRYGLAETITALREISRRWQRAHHDGSRIRIGNISRRGGGELKPHKSHRMGIDVDLWLEDKMGRNIILKDSGAYSKKLAGELADTISTNPVSDVTLLLFWDKSASPHQINQDDGHHDHFHVRFCIPARYGDLKIIKKAFAKRPNSTYRTCPTSSPTGPSLTS